MATMKQIERWLDVDNESLEDGETRTLEIVADRDNVYATLKRHVGIVDHGDRVVVERRARGTTVPDALRRLRLPRTG